MTIDRTKPEISKLPHAKLLPDPNNPRSNLGDLGPLEESLRLHGQLVPMIVYPSGQNFIICDGHRRFQAGRNLGWTEFLAYILPEAPTPVQLLKSQLSIDAHRESLGPVDLAEQYERLMAETGWTGVELAANLCISPSTVTRVLAILRLSAAEREIARELKVSSSGIYALARMSPEQRAVYLPKAADVSRDALNAKARKKQPKASGASRVICQLIGATLTIASKTTMTMDSLITLFEELLKEARKAQRDSLEVSTFAKLLRDKHRGGAA